MNSGSKHVHILIQGLHDDERGFRHLFQCKLKMERESRAQKRGY